MRNKTVSVAAGVLVTLTLGAVALALLMAYYHGNIPLLPAVLSPFLCSLIGGYVATRLARTRGLTTGALSGLVAGLIVTIVALATGGMNVSLAAILGALTICVPGGALGGWLARVRLSLELV